MDQAFTPTQRTLLYPEALGPSIGDHTSLGPRPGGPPGLQEAGLKPPGVEAADASGEARQQTEEGKVLLISGTTCPLCSVINFGHLEFPSHGGELKEP